MDKNRATSASVLYLIESAGRGGAETVVVALARARGESARVASLRSGWMWEQLAAVDVPVIGLPYSPRSDILLALRVARVVANLRPDVVHCNCFTMNTIGALGVALAGVPSLGTVHGAIYDLDTSGRRLAYRMAGSVHKRLVAVSSYLQGELHRRAGVAKSKIDVIYNGVPVPNVSPTATARLRAELGLLDSDFVIGSVGMFRPEKGYVDLVDALALARGRVPGMKLLLMGDGKCRAELAERVQERGLGGHVRFVSPSREVSTVLGALDVFALPSHTEGLSIATIEAMSCGRPVVVTDCGGPTEIVTDGLTGLVTRPCDPQGLADALVRLAEDSTLRSCIAANGKARALDAFSLEQMLRSYDRLYEEVRR